MMQRRHTIARTFARLWGLALVVLCATASFAPTAYADDVLENTPVMRRALQYRAGRHELGVVFNATLGDPYTRNMLPGLRYDYHMMEWLSFGADLMYGVPVTTSTAQQIAAKTVPSSGNHDTVFTMEQSYISYMASVHAQAAPLVGKFVAFGSLPIQFDLHATLSVGLAGLAGGPQIEVKQGSYSLAPGIGGGFRLLFSQVVGLTVDLTDVYVKRTLALTRDNAAPSPIFEGNLLFSAGVSFFLPPVLKRAD